MARRMVSEVERVAHRGGVGLRSFVAHRVTGAVLALFFVFVAVDFAFLFAGSDAYDRYRDIFDGALFHLAEIVVLGALLYHALNGLRTIAVDLSTVAARRHRRLFNAQMGSFFALFVPAAWVIVARSLS